MDFAIIDKMYEVYKNEDLSESKGFFINYKKKYGNKLIDKIKEYIEKQTGSVSKNFKSNKDVDMIDHKIVRDIVSAFDNLIMPIDFYLTDLLNQDCIEGEYDYAIEGVKSHDLFNMDIKLIEKAVKKYGDCYIDDYYKIKDLIIYVKQNKTLKTLYKDNSWYELDFEELIYNLYDYIKDKSIFKTELTSSYREDFFLFDKIRTNCAKMFNGSFEKFRPNLNSTKQIRADFGKLIFCRNLLQYYETGIMPSYEGFIDFSLDYVELINLVDDFEKLYSKNFDEKTFRENQTNIICVPEVYSTSYKLCKHKKVKIGDKLIAGFLISCLDASNSVSNIYLIHIEIDDVNNLSSNYEMQINLIPRGNLKQRLQIMRLDNWKTEQTHKNIANKLTTKTHVHLYNEFDLLRGGKNGEFDIAYNLEGEGIDFESSLKKFISILDFDKEISKTIYNLIKDELTATIDLRTDI